MTFAFEVSLALGADLTASPATWVWTDVTRYVGLPSITITRGRGDRYAAADADRCALTFLNNGGRFVPRNPLSPYYGLLNRGTPLRVRIRPTTGGAFRTQFTGSVNEWPVRWADSALTQSYAPITASGLLRRLDRARPLKSAIYRVLAASTAVGYWPMEDGSGAMAFANAAGGPVGTFTGVSLAADSAIAGSDPLPTLGTTGRVAFPVPSYTSSGTWAVAWVMRIPASSLSGAAQVMSWTTPSGTITRWQVRINPGTPDTVTLDGFAPGGGVVSSTSVNLTDASTGTELTNGRQLYFQVNGAQSGGNIDVNLTIQYVPDAGTPVASVGISWSTAATNGPVGLIYHDSVTGFGGGGHTIGHVALGTDVAFGAGTIGAAGGAGDTTGIRFASLLATQGITPLVGDLIRGPVLTTQKMGPQRTGDVLTQLREVEATELGVMHDGKDGRLELLPRRYRYNRPIDLTLSVTAGHVGWPFEPTDDDVYLRNDVTVSNVGGSSARATADAATLRAQGVYADTVTENIYQGTDLQQHADWRLNLGTTGAGLRYPSIVVNLTSNAAALGVAWCNTDIGSRIQVTGVPSGELPPETLDLILDGYTETISSTEWTATLSCSPGSQYLVAVLDSSTPRLDCRASTLAESLDATETGVDVAWADSCKWIFRDGPYVIVFGGEQGTVTAVADSVTDTFTRSVSSGWGSASSGQAWTVSGGSAVDYGVSGTRATMAVTSTAVARTAAISSVGATVDIAVIFYPTVVATVAQFEQKIRVRVNGSVFYETNVQYQTSGLIDLYLSRGVTALSSLGSVMTYTSGSAIGVRLQAIGSTIRHRIWDATGAEPTNVWTATVTDTVVPGAETDGVMLVGNRIAGNTNSTLVLQFDNLAVPNPQTLTVTRSVNGIVKTHAAGEPVHVANPIILAL